jgi:hypothetical protein
MVLEREWMNFFIVYTFPALIIGGIGLLVFFIVHSDIHKRNTIAGWLKTQATIDRSAFEERKTQRFSKSPLSIFGGYKVKYWVPAIRYSFKIIGTPFESSGYSNCSQAVYMRMKDRDRQRILAEYPAGKVVTITYNPDNPVEAYLLPLTDSSQQVIFRAIAIFVMLIALAWVGWGAADQLSGSLREKAALAKLQSSPGLLPVSMSQINLKLDQLTKEFGLDCVESNYAWMYLHYRKQLCETPPGINLAWVEIYSRSDAPEKVDSVVALFNQTDQEKKIPFFLKVVGLSFQDAESQSAQEWVKTTLSTLTQSGDSANTTIAEVQIQFDVSGKSTRINIGRTQ